MLYENKGTAFLSILLERHRLSIFSIMPCLLSSIQTIGIGMMLLSLLVVFGKFVTLSSSPCSQLRLLFLTIFLDIFLFGEVLWYFYITMCGWRVQGQLLLNSPNLKSGACSIPVKPLV